MWANCHSRFSHLCWNLPDREFRDAFSRIANRVFERASNLLAGFVGPLVGGAISFFGALIGARMQARTSFEVQRKDFESRSKAARLADEALILGTVQSISDEVEALWAHYNWEIGPHLDSLEPEQPANVFHVTPSYFVIFDAAGSLVGRIPNPTHGVKSSTFTSEPNP